MTGRESLMGDRDPKGRGADCDTPRDRLYRNDQDWFVVESFGDLGGRIVVDATGDMASELIDVGVTSWKGPSAAAAISPETATALANALRQGVATRDASPTSAVRAFVYSFLLCYAVGLVAAFGWGRHWNAYINLSLTLGSVVLWATFVKGWSSRRD